MSNNLKRLEAEMYEANRLVRALSTSTSVDDFAWKDALDKADKAKHLFDRAKAAADVPRCPRCGQTL